MQRSRAVQKILVCDLRQVHAAAGAEVVPEVEARVDLEQVVAAARGAALEIHLEDAGEADALRDLAAERDQALVPCQAQVGTVAGERGVSADLAADEPFQQLAAGRGE